MLTRTARQCVCELLSPFAQRDRLMEGRASSCGELRVETQSRQVKVWSEHFSGRCLDASMGKGPGPWCTRTQLYICTVCYQRFQAKQCITTNCRAWKQTAFPSKHCAPSGHRLSMFPKHPVHPYIVSCLRVSGAQDCAHSTNYTSACLCATRLRYNQSMCYSCLRPAYSGRLHQALLQATCDPATTKQSQAHPSNRKPRPPN